MSNKVKSLKADAWVKYLRKGQVETPYGKIDSKSPYNANIMLTYHMDMEGKIIYDEFSDKCLLVGCPPWINPEEFRIKKLDDNDAHQAMLWLEMQGVKVGKGVVYDCITGIARNNRYNPAKEFFNDLKWDGAERLGTWLSKYLGATTQPKEYLEAVGKKWMTAIVSRAYEPGSKFDHMVILEGDQGIGKSTALKSLATFNDESYFYDGNISFNDTDTLMRLQGKIIVEMAEMASFKKAVNEEIKSFISRTNDSYRTPYGRTVSDRPRYFVLSGSTNEREYLPPDESGHRRYWPVACGKIDSVGLGRDNEQLWAEAVHLYKKKYPTWVQPEEVGMFTAQQESRVIKDAWLDIIEKSLSARGLNETHIDDVFDWIEIKPSARDNFSRKRVKDVLHQLGFKEARESVTRRRIWKRD